LGYPAPSLSNPTAQLLPKISITARRHPVGALGETQLAVIAHLRKSARD
jgi:hypothetical protein